MSYLPDERYARRQGNSRLQTHFVMSWKALSESGLGIWQWTRRGAALRARGAPRHVGFALLFRVDDERRRHAVVHCSDLAPCPLDSHDRLSCCGSADLRGCAVPHDYGRRPGRVRLAWDLADACSYLPRVERFPCMTSKWSA